MLRFIALFMAFWSMTATAETGAAQTPISGQIITYKAGNGGMSATAGVDWGRYTKIQLDRATVEFRENWLSDQQKTNRSPIRTADVEPIKSEMSDLLDKVLTRALPDMGGYTLTTESGPDVLRFTPRIAKLDVYAPGLVQGYVGHVLIDSKGSMVLVMDISDSISGTLLASAWQPQVDNGKGFTDSANVGSNRSAFGQMMRRWSSWLINLLDTLRNQAPG